MGDERSFGVQELDSARYLAQAEESAEPEVELPVGRARARQRSGLENVMRWLTPLVIVMLVAAGGGIYWQNRAAIASKAGELKGRRSAVDLLLWAGGSKKTFKQGITDALKRAQRDSAFPIDQKPAFKTEFENVDFSNLSNSWNGGMNGKR